MKNYFGWKDQPDLKNDSSRKADGLQVTDSIHTRTLYAADDTWLQNIEAHAANIYQKTLIPSFNLHLWCSVQ